MLLFISGHGNEDFLIMIFIKIELGGTTIDINTLPHVTKHITKHSAHGGDLRGIFKYLVIALLYFLLV